VIAEALNLVPVLCSITDGQSGSLATRLPMAAAKQAQDEPDTGPEGNAQLSL